MKERCVVYIELIHISIRSTRKDWNEIIAHLSGNQKLPHVLTLTELNVDETICRINRVHGYDSYFYCGDKRRGGGILVFIKKEWLSEKVELELMAAEIVAVKILCKQTTFLHCALYPPPSSDLHDFLAKLETLLRKFDSERNLILAGDINIDTLHPSMKVIGQYCYILAQFSVENIISGVPQEEYMKDRLTKFCIDPIGAAPLTSLHYLA